MSIFKHINFMLVCITVLTFLAPHQTNAGIAMYDEGRRTVMGVELLQDKENPLHYYYVPQFPRLATKDDGTFEFLFMKYVGENDDGSGGLFHALIEFTLPEDLIEEVQNKLQQDVPGAEIVGVVRMLQDFETDNEGQSNFELVSATLSGGSEETEFKRKVIKSGHAPFQPGSKAAVAALLTPQMATLLWESMQSPTSDISVTINGYYEAAVKGYNAIVTADVSQIYEHISKVYSYQNEYTKRQTQKIVDELQDQKILTIDVFDRSASTGVKANDMQAILDIVTNKLTELLFNTQSGWAKDPERVPAVTQGQLQGRRKKGFFARLFGGASDTKYYTDDQYVLKNQKDIKTRTFRLNLSKSATIKVPIHTSGNLGGLYDIFDNKEREQYFRTVNMNDPAFQKREIHFQVDLDYVDSFQDLINFASVSFLKKYNGDHNDVLKELKFGANTENMNSMQQSFFYPRLGLSGQQWLQYQYSVIWNLKGGAILRVPPVEGQWITSIDPVIALAPPFEKRIVIIDMDPLLFSKNEIASVKIQFASILAKKKRIVKDIIMRAGDVEATRQVAIYLDKDAPLVYKETWYSAHGTFKDDLKPVEGDYLYVVPPSPEQFKSIK